MLFEGCMYVSKCVCMYVVYRRAVCKEVRSFIIDAEVVAYDREKGCLLPFQILSTRKRKVEEGEVSLRILLYMWSI